MRDVLLGLVAVAAGALFCFRGYAAMRLVIPVWGAFTGFLLGAGLGSEIRGERFLGGPVSWLVGIAAGLVLALLAYAFYEVAVVLSMAAVGFVLGSTLLVALEVRWAWAVVAAGVAVGLLLAVLTIVADLPMILLAAVTATGGAGTLVAGAMLLAGALDSADLTGSTATDRINDSAGWWLLYAGLAVVGLVVQLRAVRSARRTVRAQWADRGGAVARG